MATAFIAASFQTHAQGTLVYDQQSTNPIVPRGHVGVDGLDIQPDPLTQSFIPTLSAIDFVQLEFQDITSNGNNGATVYVNIWTGSPNTNSATLLGSTTPVYMPDGFGDNGNSAGNTNFYFATPITLIPGQIYYLQPVVQSGDNPWDVITIGDTYSNGQLFDKGLGFSTDLWFGEGIVSTPEPTALVLIGLSGVLACAFKRRSKLFIVLGTGALLLGSVQAQTLSLQSTPDTVVQAVADEAGLAPASTLPRTGTFWIIMPSYDGNLTALPYPTLPASLSASPVYSVSGNVFIVDDSGSQLLPSSTRRMSSAMAASVVTRQASTVANLIATMQADSLSPGGGSGTNSGAGFYSDSFNYQVPTNGLWLEITNVSNGLVYLNLHNATNLVYGIYTSPDLLIPFTNWTPVSEIWPTNQTTNVLPFTISASFYPSEFVRAMDWTGVDANSNGIPDWWEWKFFNPSTLAYHLSTNAVARTNGFSYIYNATVELANWMADTYSGINLAHLTNAVWSTNFWLKGVQGLSATCIGYSNGYSGQCLLTMISPRHYLDATHVGIGDMIAFLDTNNVIYWRRSVQRVDISIGPIDTSVGILDEDLPPSVGYMQVLPPSFINYLPASISSVVQGIGMNQDMRLFGQPMMFIGQYANWNYATNALYGLTTNWNVAIRGGDSSNPEMLLVGNQLVLVSHNHFFGGGPNYASQIPAINEQMHYLSTNNSAGSDYQVALFSLTNWPTVH